ncbi:MAG: DUF4349 domain-containing protein [Bacteroidales bacterium]|nr:DUF4349 domain-containing protein [Bacteroidales bacterium]MDD3431032.1 DUF4349 domain-containing protein [Bacteroidales bacterium]MDD4362454.1 DUF4349 domain-containing protein [Bacteroidales bacterium]MDD4430801.1 DUF4349 domain-containing protein [Bacteroidales bacterium]
MKKILYLLLLSALLGACQQKDKDSILSPDMMMSEDVKFESREDLKLKGRVAGAQAYAAGNAAVSESTIADAAVNQESEATDKKKIIRDGDMSIKVKSAQETKTKVDSLLIPFNAYYASENFNNNDREATFYLRLRIPATAFDRFMACLEKGGYGEVLNKDIRARDVTDQFIDLETRLKNKRNYLTRYNSLLKDAKTVKDILQIQEEIRGLEEEIESTTGRLKYLSDQVDYSTLQLYLTEIKDFQYQPEERDRFSEKLKQALTKGWYGVVDLVIFLFKIWPLWLLLGVALIFLKRRSRPTKKARTKKE